MRRTGAYGSENAALMATFKDWLNRQHLLNNQAVILGIVQDDPATVQPGNCRYDVGLIVTDLKKYPDTRILYGQLQGGNYAIFSIEHTVDAVQQAWRSIFDDLTKANRSFDNTRPIIERYTAQKVKQQLCELCVPIL